MAYVRKPGPEIINAPHCQGVQSATPKSRKPRPEIKEHGGVIERLERGSKEIMGRIDATKKEIDALFDIES